MIRNLKLFQIIILMLMITENAEAGKRQKKFFNDEQTRNQQIQSSKKKPIPVSQSFSQTTGQMRLCNLSPAQFALALTLVSVAGWALIPETPDLPSRDSFLGASLKAPFSVKNMAPIPCIPPTASQPVLPSQASGIGLVHPGLYSSIASFSQLKKICTDNELFFHNEQGPQCDLRAQQHARIWMFDQFFSESEADARICAEFVNLYLEKMFFDGKIPPAKAFFGVADNEFIHIIKLLSGFFHRSREENEFKDSDGLHFVKTDSAFPGMDNMDEWKTYIAQFQPSSMASFNGIEIIADNLCAEMTVLLPESMNRCAELNALPWERKLAMAVEIIGFKNELHDFEVLTRNFHFFPPLSRYEIERSLLQLKKDTLQLYDHDPITAAAYVHIAYVRIHPHNDANGRIARALMNLILMSAGYDRAVFPSNEEYSEAVNQAVRANQPEIFEEFLRKIIVMQSKNRSTFDKLFRKLDNCKEGCQKIVEKIAKDMD